MTKLWMKATSAGVILALVLSFSPARGEPPPSAPEQSRQQEAKPSDHYFKPPVPDFPGGTVAGETRGTVKPTTPLPTIEIIAPDRHSGLTTSATPSLFFYVSRRVTDPTRLTIRAPMQPTPVLEANILPPPAAAIYAIRLTDYRVRLEPGIVYTWSVSVIRNPNAPARDIVASASLVRVPIDPNLDATVRAAPASGRAVLLANAGLWYDAVAAAADLNQRAVLNVLMNEVGLVEPARYDLQTPGGVLSSRP
jgi:hypothetical protein